MPLRLFMPEEPKQEGEQEDKPWLELICQEITGMPVRPEIPVKVREQPEMLQVVVVPEEIREYQVMFPILQLMTQEEDQVREARREEEQEELTALQEMLDPQE